MTSDKAAGACRDAAGRLQKDIDRKHESARNMRALPATRKRTQDSQGIYNDAVRLEKFQRVLNQLADMHEQGTVPEALRFFTSRAAVERGVWANEALKTLFEQTNRPETPAELLQRLERGFLLEGIRGFFPTPRVIADQLAWSGPIREDDLMLEPGAGTGALIDAALRIQPKLKVHYFERNYSLSEFLQTKYAGNQNLYMPGRDFTEFNLAEYAPRYSVILMNPPFETGQDAEHIARAYELLRPGGWLAAIAGAGVFFRSDKKSEQFRELLSDTSASIRDLPVDAFKASGTDANCKSVLIHKPIGAAC